MNDAVTIKIQGLDELQKKLEELPRDVAKRGIRASLREGAKRIAEAMAAHAPRDTGFLALHFGIRTKMFRNDLAGSAFIGPEGHIDYPEHGGYRTKENDRGKKYQVGRIAVVRVARFLEFGTTKTAKQPFMTQAFEDQKESALAAIVGKLRDFLEKAAR